MEEKENFTSNQQNINSHENISEEKILEEFSDIIDGPEKEYFRLAIGVDGKWYPSDACLKDDIEDNNSGLKEINSLRVKSYTYKNDSARHKHVGVIAQELQQVFPNSVQKDSSGNLMINTEEIFFAMVNSIKELSAEINELKMKIGK